VIRSCEALSGGQLHFVTVEAIMLKLSLVALFIFSLAWRSTPTEATSKKESLVLK